MDLVRFVQEVKDSDSPGYVCVQGEKGFMKVDSKPNIASELKTVYADENIKEKSKRCSRSDGSCNDHRRL